jgi:hypothetical protein
MTRGPATAAASSTGVEEDVAGEVGGSAPGAGKELPADVGRASSDAGDTSTDVNGVLLAVHDKKDPTGVAVRDTYVASSSDAGSYPKLAGAWLSSQEIGVREAAAAGLAATAASGPTGVSAPARSSPPLANEAPLFGPGSAPLTSNDHSIDEELGDQDGFVTASKGAAVGSDAAAPATVFASVTTWDEIVGEIALAVAPLGGC